MRHIFTHRRNRNGCLPDWIAYFNNDFNTFEAGNTEAEALGKLVMSNPMTFSVAVHESYERRYEHYEE